MVEYPTEGFVKEAAVGVAGDPACFLGLLLSSNSCFISSVSAVTLLGVPVAAAAGCFFFGELFLVVGVVAAAAGLLTCL